MAISPKNSAILERMLSSDFYFSPLKFALWAYEWKTGDLKEFDGPRKWQREVMVEMEQYLRQATQQKTITNTLPDFFRMAMASGRGPGKSAFIGMISHWFMSTRIGSSTWVAANGEPQLRAKTFPEIAKWVARGINSEFFDIASTAITPSKWFKEFIESPQGLSKSTRYYYIAGQLWSEENPDAFAGAHNFDGELAIFDEASSIPENIWTVQEGVFTENIPDRFWLTFSNPRQNTGAFFDCFHRNKSMWRTRQIDSRTVEGINHTPFENIIARYGEDSDEAKVEVYGQFPSVGDNQFISPKLVDEAMEREPSPEPNAPTVMGVDVARFGNDASILAIRRGRTLLRMIRYHGLDTMALVGKVIEAIKVWKPDLTIVDEGGLGAGVLDRLVEQNYKVRGVSFGSRADNPIAYFNKRSEMWGTMRDWLRTATIGSMGDNPAADNKALKADLCAPQYKTSSNGSIQLESKGDMKKRGIPSPDCFVAGTLITTPHGRIPIEQVRVGDLVTTPFGASRVLMVHETVVESITTVTFSDGRVLSGKGSHRVFTFDKGWVRLNALAMSNGIELDSFIRRLLWRFLAKSFTRVSHSGFKHQVDTISQGEPLSRKDFFIVEFGSSILGRFLKNTISTIKTAIGQTIGLKTLSVSSVGITSAPTWSNVWQTRNDQQTNGKDSLKPEKQPQRGTVVTKVEHGTLNTERTHGKIDNLYPLLNLVNTAGRRMKRISQIVRNSVQTTVCRLQRIVGTKAKCLFAKPATKNSFIINTQLECTVVTSAPKPQTSNPSLLKNLVLFADRCLSVVGLSLKNVVLVSVQVSSQTKTETYNLTLTEDNVYYANGILVENCGDALAISLAYPVGSGLLTSDQFRVWSGDIPVLDNVIQSYHGAYTEKTSNDATAGTVWGVCEYKGDRVMLLLDAWTEKMTYTALRQKIIRDWHAEYGNPTKGARVYKADTVLIGSEGAGDSLVLDLRGANIGVPNYKNGDIDLIERVHQSAPIFDMGAVYVMPSSKAAGQPISWSRPLLEQCDRFPNDTETGLIDTMTRAMLFVRDNKLLEMQKAEPDEEPYERDYSQPTRLTYANPYTA
jgi:phage terminase large subunit-like protein